jgi:putative oxidoreductase
MQLQQLSTSIGLLILRVGAGGYLVTHGYGKVQMLLAGEADKFGDPIGLGSNMSLFLVVLAEFVGALLVIVGLATRLAAVPAVIAMAVAAFVAHANDPWTMQAAAQLFQSGQAKTWSSKEPALLFLTAFLTLVFTGPGRVSLDHLILRRRAQRRQHKAPGAHA